MNIPFVTPSLSLMIPFILTKWAGSGHYTELLHCVLLPCFTLLSLCRYKPWLSSDFHFSIYSLPFLHTGPYQQLFHVCLLVCWLNWNLHSHSWTFTPNQILYIQWPIIFIPELPTLVSNLLCPKLTICSTTSKLSFSLFLFVTGITFSRPFKPKTLATIYDSFIMFLSTLSN